MVFQSYALWPHLTVAGNVGYPLRLRREPRPAIRQRVADILAVVGLAGFADRPVGTLSGGQQQRVALARALVARPRLLLYDEPLSNLDAKLRVAICTELAGLHRRLGTTSLYVTHDQTEALTLSDRIVVLADGRIQQVGTPAVIWERPANAFVADFIGVDNLLPGTVDAGCVAVTGLPGRLPADPAGLTGDVVIAVRAADVHIGPDGELPATVVAVTYLGDQIEHQLRAGDVLLRARTPVAGMRSEHTPAPGDPVRVSIDSGAVLVLPPK